MANAQSARPKIMKYNVPVLKTWKVIHIMSAARYIRPVLPLNHNNRNLAHPVHHVMADFALNLANLRNNAIAVRFARETFVLNNACTQMSVKLVQLALMAFAKAVVQAKMIAQGIKFAKIKNVPIFATRTIVAQMNRVRLMLVNPCVYAKKAFSVSHPEDVKKRNVLAIKIVQATKHVKMANALTCATHQILVVKMPSAGCKITKPVAFVHPGSLAMPLRNALWMKMIVPPVKNVGKMLDVLTNSEAMTVNAIKGVEGMPF